MPSLKGAFEEKIAIIGSGPAGLSCAYFLTRHTGFSAALTADGKIESLIALRSELINGNVFAHFHTAPDLYAHGFAARVSTRCGTGRVSMFCLESRDEMPASREEILEATEEKVAIHNGWGPQEILTENGRTV